MDEFALIHAAQNGDIDSFNELVLRYQEIAYNQAFWIMKNPAEAEDCTQDAFIKAFQRLSTFRKGSFKSWLLRIVTNTCLDELRRIKRVEIISITPQDEDGKEQDLSELLPDSGVSIEEQVETSELRSLLQRYLGELRSDHRDIIHLIDVLELDYEEAAQALDVPVGTVKSRLARGRWHLRNLIMGDPDLDSKWVPASLAM
jgi:RNA polymerase sigma-70 factor (ECF subfamily)